MIKIDVSQLKDWKSWIKDWKGQFKGWLKDQKWLIFDLFWLVSNLSIVIRHVLIDFAAMIYLDSRIQIKISWLNDDSNPIPNKM